jgi:hypothetical protein
MVLLCGLLLLWKIRIIRQTFGGVGLRRGRTESGQDPRRTIRLFGGNFVKVTVKKNASLLCRNAFQEKLEFEIDKDNVVSNR